MSTLVSLKPKLGWVSSELFDDRMDSSFYLSQIELGLDKIFNKKDIKLLTLEDITRRIVDGPFGSAVLANDYVSEGIPFLRVQNVTDYGLNLDDVIFISKECNKRIARSQAVKGNIVFTKTGWLGNTCVLTSEYDVYNIRGDLAVLECKDDVDPYYISTYLNSSFGKKVTSSFGSGSTRPRILLSNIRKIPVPIPSEKIQSYIGNKVRKAEELREEAKRLKKEAEDILEKELGVNIVNVNQENTQKYTWVTCESIDDRIDAGFYSAKYKVLDAIKKKHEIIFMSEIINGIYTGNTPSSDYNSNDNDGVPLIAVNNVKPNLIEIADNIRKVALNDNLLLTEENDMVITRVGSVGVCAIIEEYEKGLAVSDNVIIVKLKERIPIRYLSFYLNSVTGVLQVERMVKGAVQPVINYQSINKFFIPILSSESMIAIDEKLKKYKLNLRNARRLIEEAKQDIEDLIEGKFDESKISEGV